MDDTRPCLNCRERPIEPDAGPFCQACYTLLVEEYARHLDEQEGRRGKSPEALGGEVDG